MSLEFLSPHAGDGPTPPARSPMEREARAAGARVEVRYGWNVAVAYGPVDGEVETLRRTAGWCDQSHLGKLELQGPAGSVARIVAEITNGASLDCGQATRAFDAWWCPVTAERVVVVSEPYATRELRERLMAAAGDAAAHLVDLTAGYAALAIAGPLAHEVLARFTALDVRARTLPPDGFRPGSIARTPGMLLREADERFVFWFGAALGSYMWTVATDAARHLGGGPVGVDALALASAARVVEEQATHA